MNRKVTSLECKERALEALRGKWLTCLIAVFIFTLITESASMIDTYLEYQYKKDHGYTNYEIALDKNSKESKNSDSITTALVNNGIKSSSAHTSIIELTTGNTEYQTPFWLTSLQLAINIFTLPLTVGYALFFLLIIQGKEPTIKTLFESYGYFLNILLTKLYVGLRIFIGLILLIIPGIIAIYKYAFVDYIIAEDGDIRCKAATDKSSDMIYGHKVELFVLELSLLGWSILAGITSTLLAFVFYSLNLATLAILFAIIPGLFFCVYSSSAVAAFYQTIKEQTNKNKEDINSYEYN